MRSNPMVALMLAIGLANGAAAGPLAPTRPSEVVTLVPSFDPAGCAGGASGVRFDTIVTREGTYVPLVIPPKRILVLTSVRWLAQGPANEEFFFSLRPGPEAAGFSGVTLPGSRSDAGGRSSGEARLDPGLVIRDVPNLCLRINTTAGGIIGNASATGYFAKDR